jgi:hypothetical protein
MGLHQIKLLLYHKRNDHQIEEAACRVGENLASYTSGKGLTTNIYMNLKNLNSPQINDQMKKWANELNRAFSKEELQMAKKYMKKCSTSLAIKEVQIKTMLRFHFTPVRMATIKNTTNDKCWRGCGEKGTLIHCWWEYKLS